MAPTLRTAALLAVISLSALVVPVAVTAVAALALLGMAVADATLVRGRPEVRRRAPDVIARGVADSFSLEVEPPPSRSVLVRQPAPADVELRPAEGTPPLRGEIVGHRRGRRVLGPAGVRIEGPLGLAAAYRRAGATHELRVFPNLPAARRAVAAVRRSRFRDPGLRNRGALGLGTEFERVRDYSPDDDIRQVNWLATARLGRPMSNDHRLEQDRDVVALVDCGRLMAAPTGSGSLLDAALDAVTVLAAVADELGDRFGAIAFDADLRHELPPQRSGGQRAARALFDLEPRALESDYVRAFHRVGAGKRAFVVVFTDLLEEVAARPLVDAVPVLAGRHAVAVATVSDPDLQLATTQTPQDVLAAYRAAAALDVLAARREVVARLRRAGAQVVEADPAGLGPACVRAYIRAKSRALL